MRARSTAAWMLIATGVAVLFVWAPTDAVAQSEPHAALIRLDSAIHPVAGRFFARGLEKAVTGGAQFVVVELDTPGGLISTTRDMVSTILQSPIPVVVYVTPQGSRAASAGTFILAAAHVAAMSPATNVGAASPVGAGGAELDDTIRSKATQDAAAIAPEHRSAEGPQCRCAGEDCAGGGVVHGVRGAGAGDNRCRRPGPGRSAGEARRHDGGPGRGPGHSGFEWHRDRHHRTQSG